VTKDELGAARLDAENSADVGLLASRLSDALDHIAALEKERDGWRRLAEKAEMAASEAVVDYAALLEGIQRMRNLLMYPQDEWHQVAADVIRVGNGLTAVDHPGATLLDEHRKALNDAEVCGYARCTDDMQKALVRARNEGREEVARHMDMLGEPFEARRIRAMKEPVPCCERDTNGDGNCDRHQRCES
jgi:hypothetical protein